MFHREESVKFFSIHLNDRADSKHRGLFQDVKDIVAFGPVSSIVYCSRRGSCQRRDLKLKSMFSAVPSGIQKVKGNFFEPLTSTTEKMQTHSVEG